MAGVELLGATLLRYVLISGREDAKRGLAWQAKSKATRNEWSHAALTRDNQGGVALFLNGQRVRPRFNER